MKKILTWSVALVLLALLGKYTFTKLTTKKESPQNHLTNSQPEALPVQVTRVTRGDIDKTITLTGEVLPLVEVQVAAKIQGRLERLRLPDGSPIAGGTIIKKAGIDIAIIDHEIMAAQVDEAKSRQQLAQASLQLASAQLKSAKREWQRMKKLYAAGKGPATQQMLDEAETTYEVTVAQKASAEAQLTQAKTSLRLAELNRQESIIKAPICGIVSKKQLDEGNLVSPGMPIVTILQLDPIKVMLPLPQRYLGLVTPGSSTITIHLDAYGKESLTATVYQIHPEADRATRTLPLEIRLANPTYRLRPGMFVTASLTLMQHHNVPIISADALFRQEGKYYAFVVNGGHARQVQVIPGIRKGNQLEIISGLKPGERLVTVGQAALTDGVTVKILREAKK